MFLDLGCGYFYDNFSQLLAETLIDKRLWVYTTSIANCIYFVKMNFYVYLATFCIYHCLVSTSNDSGLGSDKSCKTNTLTLWACFCHEIATCKVPDPFIVSQVLAHTRQTPAVVLWDTDQNLFGVANSPRQITDIAIS